MVVADFMAAVEAFTAVGEAMAAVATDNQRSFRRGLAVTSCGPFFFSAEFAPARAGIAAEKAR
jgi:hypothetical protein